MKYTAFIILAFTCTLQVAFAQRINYYPDSIRIELPDQKTVVVFELRQYKNNTSFIKDFPSFLKEILGHVEKSSPANFQETGPYRIDVRLVAQGEKEMLSMGSEHSFKPVGEKTLINIRPIETPVTQVTVKDKQIVELLPPGWELSIESKEAKVSLYSESYQSLVTVTTVDFTSLSDKLVKEVNVTSLGKSTIRSRMVFHDNKIEQSSVTRKYPGDNISLGVTAGVGLFRDKLYPQLSLNLALTFRDHFGKQNIRTGLVYDNLIFAEKIAEGYQTNVNSFLSLSFEKNFNTKSKGAQWSGIGAGFLVRKNGDYFTGNTAKIFIIHEMENRRVSILPEFYLTDDFKKFAFGMTLKYTF